nr:hypothetical protein [Anaerolineales bacterium]
TYTLCMTCHGSAGTGANTNVADGKYLNRGAPLTSATTVNADLLGGGFTTFRGRAVTSAHDATGASTLGWGNGVVRGQTAALTSPLNCASCHDPHGSPNYRIIKANVNAVAVAVTPVDEGAGKNYGAEAWGAGQSALCAACHSAYHQTAANQGSTLQGGSYTHRVDMQWNSAYAGPLNPESTGLGGMTLPLAETGAAGAGSGVVVCQTCHLPHGGSAAMSGIANGGPLGTGTLPGNTSAADSALLRLDNRATCEVCHQK